VEFFDELRTNGGGIEMIEKNSVHAEALEA
jgi:hypothetical protein